MPYLDPNQYPLARPIFEPFDPYHLCVQAVLAGTAPGQVWIDNLEKPRVAFVSGSEGYYLGGDPRCLDDDPRRQGALAPGVYQELREVIPPFAYLLVDPPGWEDVLGQVWKNIAVRPHPRQHFVFRKQSAPAWRDRVPEGAEVLPIDEDFFSLDGLKNHETVMGWVDGWRSREYFLTSGVGTCLVIGNTITSWSMMDCALGDRCEIGVFTDRSYRRQGLGYLVVSATIEACLARGFREIGWQCLSSNAGSIAVANRTGFVKERDYLAFSSGLPAENASDLTPAEYADWALHYERASRQEIGWAFMAAQAWASAGSPSNALANLHFLQEKGWKGRREWFAGNWRLESLRSLPEFQSLEANLVED